MKLFNNIFINNPFSHKPHITWAARSIFHKFSKVVDWQVACAHNFTLRFILSCPPAVQGGTGLVGGKISLVSKGRELKGQWVTSNLQSTFPLLSLDQPGQALPEGNPAFRKSLFYSFSHNQLPFQHFHSQANEFLSHPEHQFLWKVSFPLKQPTQAADVRR